MVRQLGHDCFVESPTEFIIHLWPHYGRYKARDSECRKMNETNGTDHFPKTRVYLATQDIPRFVRNSIIRYRIHKFRSKIQVCNI